MKSRAIACATEDNCWFSFLLRKPLNEESMKGLYLALFVLLAFFLLQAGTVLAEKSDGGNKGSEIAVDSGELSKMNLAMQKAGFTGDQITRSQTALLEAAGDGVPQEVLFGKINEGIVKGASADQILRAMGIVRERHRRAAQYLQELGVSGEHGEAVRQFLVNAQAAGMAPDDLSRVVSRLQKGAVHIKERGDRELLVSESLRFVQEIRRLGGGSKPVANLAESMLQKGAQSHDFSEMTANFKKVMHRDMLEEQMRLCLGDIEASGNMTEARHAVRARVSGWTQQVAQPDPVMNVNRSGQKSSPESGSGQPNGSDGQSGGSNGQGGGGTGSGTGTGGNSGGGKGQQGK